MPEIKVKYLPGRPSLPPPSYQTPRSAGLDITAAHELVLDPGERGLVGTGLAFAVPEGYEGQVRPRSGLAWRDGVTVLNTPGTLDADYRGELKILLINHGQDTYCVSVGDRIAQLVISRNEPVMVTVVESLGETERGQGGFGHTGR